MLWRNAFDFIWHTYSLRYLLVMGVPVANVLVVSRARPAAEPCPNQSDLLFYVFPFEFWQVSAWKKNIGHAKLECFKCVDVKRYVGWTLASEREPRMDSVDLHISEYMITYLNTKTSPAHLGDSVLPTGKPCPSSEYWSPIPLAQAAGALRSHWWFVSVGLSNLHQLPGSKLFWGGWLGLEF